MRALWDELDDDKSGQIGLEEIDKVRSGSEDRSGRRHCQEPNDHERGQSCDCARGSSRREGR